MRKLNTERLSNFLSITQQINKEPGIDVASLVHRLCLYLLSMKYHPWTTTKRPSKFKLGGQGHKHSVHSSASSSILCTATNEPTMEWDAGPARRDIVMNSVRQDNQAKLDYPRSSSTTSRMIYTWWKPMEWEFKTNITNIQNRQILR